MERTISEESTLADADDGSCGSLPAYTNLPLFGPPSKTLPKPPHPYKTGWRFKAHIHSPPEPTPVVYDCCTSDRRGRAERYQVSPIERCQRHPPLPGLTGTGTLELEIQKLLQTGDGYQTQVFTVTLCGSSGFQSDYEWEIPSQTELVAKVFDPLYFNDDGGYLDPFRCMDKFYTHAAGAFRALLDFQGRGIPCYYGSYSICLPLPDTPDVCREVRMILMEFIPGAPMSQFRPDQLSQPIRQKILYTILDLESHIYEKDISLIDLAPRNVMLDRIDQQEPLIVFIDFDDSLFQRNEDDSILDVSERFLGQYISPLLRWRDLPHEFEKWVDWNWVLWLESEFSHTKSTITPEMREAWEI